MAFHPEKRKLKVEWSSLVGLHGCQKGDGSVINRRYQLIHTKDIRSLNAGKR